jgi:NTP pyrophosphatase (non-canonical NTP hydrolase)
MSDITDDLSLEPVPSRTIAIVPEIEYETPSLGERIDESFEVSTSHGWLPTARAGDVLERDACAYRRPKRDQVAVVSLGSMHETAKAIHRNAVAHGWWDRDRNDGETIALIHSELSEALEALRSGEGARSTKIDGFLAIEEELADVIIRVLDYAEGRSWRVCDAVAAKHAYNVTRPYMHGKKF